MGSVPSTPRKRDLPSPDALESLIAAFVGEKSIPFASGFWRQLLEIPLDLHWSNDRVFQACYALAQNNHRTRHLAKLLIHLACCLQDCASTPSSAFTKALHAVYLSTVFLKHAIEHTKANNFEELYLILDENEGVPDMFSKANLVLLPLNVFFGSGYEVSRSLLARISLHVLLILVHFRKCLLVDDRISDGGYDSSAFGPVFAEGICFLENPYCKALENASDVQFDRVDIEGNAHGDPIVRVPFASLLDTLGMCLADESSALLLYSLLNGNAGFLEYVLVRTDLDTVLMPILETLYNAPKRTSNQIYMLLIILLILSQDSTFNSSVHKLLLPSVPWYQERRLHHISLGSLMVIVLTRTVKCNLSRLQDVYLHTNCLATLANMAPHVHRLDAYASERLVSLFHLLSRKYIKLARIQDNKIQIGQYNSTEGDSVLEDSMELHIYTDFLRIVLEILNSILTYALPRNPEVVYALMHRQEVFQPFRSHPRFTELLENIFIVLDFFNSRMDTQEVDGEWSVEKVFQVISNNCKAWRGEGMKMFNQLRFTYEQESHPEEFFSPYVWQLTVSNCGFACDSSKTNLFPVISREANILHSQSALDAEKNHEHEDRELNVQEIQLDP